MSVTLKPVAVGQNGAQAAANINESHVNLNAAVMPIGGEVGDVLTKLGSDNYNAVWTTPSAVIIESAVVLGNGLNGNIEIGDITVSKVIRIAYSIERGSLLETGNLVITNVAGTLINKQYTSNDKSNVALSKDISGNILRLHWDDSSSPNGNDSTITMQIIKQAV